MSKNLDLDFTDKEKKQLWNVFFFKTLSVINVESDTRQKSLPRTGKIKAQHWVTHEDWNPRALGQKCKIVKEWAPPTAECRGHMGRWRRRRARPLELSVCSVGGKHHLLPVTRQRVQGVNNYLVKNSLYPITRFIILKTQIRRKDPLPATGVATLACPQNPPEGRG